MIFKEDALEYIKELTKQDKKINDTELVEE